MPILLKDYYHKIQAVRITRENFEKLRELDIGDGVLDCGLEECEGDWFILGTNGYELMSGGEVLISVKKGK